MKTFCCFLLLLLGIKAAAQKGAQPVAENPPHKLVVNINPLTLVNLDQRLMIGIERHLKKRWSAVADAGFVLHSNYIENIQATQGFELRPALRYYFGHRATDYLQAQLQYRLVNYKMHDWLGKDCVAGVPTYEQLQDFTYRKQQLGGALVFGSTERLGKRWLIDISVGLGLQYRTQHVSGKEGCCYVPQLNIVGEARQEDLWIPIIPIAIKLGYMAK